MKKSYKMLTVTATLCGFGFIPANVLACEGCEDDYIADTHNQNDIVLSANYDSINYVTTTEINGEINDIVVDAQVSWDNIEEEYNALDSEYNSTNETIDILDNDLINLTTEYNNINNEISMVENETTKVICDLDATKNSIDKDLDVIGDEALDWFWSTDLKSTEKMHIMSYQTAFYDAYDVFKPTIDDVKDTFDELVDATENYKNTFDADEYNKTVKDLNLPVVNYQNMLEATDNLADIIKDIPDATKWFNSLTDFATKVKEIQNRNLEDAFKELGSLKEKYTKKKELNTSIVEKVKEKEKEEEKLKNIYDEKFELEKQLEEAKIALEKAQNIQKSVSEGLYFTVPNDPTYDHFNELVQAYFDYMDSIADTNKPSEEQPEVNDTVTVIEIPANDIMQADDYKPLNSVSTQAVVSNDNLSTATGTNFAGTMMGMTTALGGMLLTGKKRKNEKDC